MGGPQNGGFLAGGKKSVPKLSRLGELLNTQKNVHFLCTPGAPPGGAQKCPSGGPLKRPPKRTLYNTKTIYNGSPKGSKNGPILEVPEGPPGGPPRGARGARAGGRNFPPPEISPGILGPPGGPPEGGPRGVQMGGSGGAG